MPDWAPELRRRLSQLRLLPEREAEIVEELSQHLEDRWRELTAGGTPPDEATRLALGEFREGNLLARRLAPLRQAQAPLAAALGAPTGSVLTDVRHDLRYAARTLRKRPAFALAAVLTLAVGIGSNAAIFSVINAVLLRPLPFPGSERLTALYTRYLPATGFDFPFFSLSGPEFDDIRSRVDAFSDVAAYSFESRNLARDSGGAERVLTLAVSARFLEVLGVGPARGRTFTEEEAQRPESCFALLPADPTLDKEQTIGSRIRLDDAPCDVVGVMPEGFGFRDDRVKVWTSLRLDLEENDDNRQSHRLQAIARLRDGVSPVQADAELQSLRAYWARLHPDHYAKGHFAVTRPLHEDIVGEQRDALLLLTGAVLFVMLIVCVNVASLLVANAETRRREFALRHALGARRSRLIRQLVTEALLLAAVGGSLGVLLAKILLGGLLALYPDRLPVLQPVTIDYAAAGYALALVIVAGLLVGLVPALAATGSQLQPALRSEARTATASPRALAARSLLVIGQLALSVTLLVGALLLMRSYRHLQQVDLGIRPDRLLTLSVSIPAARQPDAAAARRTLAAIEERLAATAGVEVAGAMSNLPLASGGPADSFVIEGRALPAAGAAAWSARYLMATPRAFRALGIPLRSGRHLGEDDLPGRPMVAVVNEAAARLHWPGEDPIGRTIRYYPQDVNVPLRIVGVVGDVRSLGANQPAPPAVYTALAQAPRPPYTGRTMTFVVRATGDPGALIPLARAAVAAIDPELPAANVRSMADVVSTAAGQPRFTTLVMSFFAGVAFLLAAIGLYGVLGHAVEQRRREIGVRIALGAGKREIFRLIVGDGMRLALVGALLGVPAAVGLTRLMGGVLSGVTGTDPLTYSAVVSLLAASAFVASYWPARRAARVDPLVALRTE